MRKLLIVAFAATGLMAPAAQAATADTPKGPCERQQELFETANVQMDMYVPYSREICAVTG